MTYSSDIEISHVVSGLIDHTLPKPEWTHNAHFAAAIGLLSDGQRDVFGQMPTIIRTYNEATGVENSDSDGYHETITMASLRGAKDFLDKAPDEQPLYVTVNALLATQMGRSDWLLEYWSKETLFSVEARYRWVDPDLKSLPF